MATGLVGAGVQAEVQHEGSRVLGSHDVRAAEGVGQVVAVERGLVVGVDRDAVSLKLERVDRLGGHGVGDGALTGLAGEELVLDGGSVEGNGVVRHHLTLRGGSAVELLVGEESQAMPVAVLVGVQRVHVLGRAEADVHGLDGPLQLREQDGVGGLEDALGLEAMHADQGEADTADVDVVDLGVHKDVVHVQLEVQRAEVSDGRAGSQNGRVGGPGVHALDGNGRGQTLGTSISGSLLLDGEAQPEVTGSGKQDAALLLEVDGDVALTVGDSHGSDSEARVAVEPEQEGNPQVKSGLHQLGRLGAVHHGDDLAGRHGGGGGGTDGGVAVDVEQVGHDGRPGGGTGHSGQRGDTLNGDLLSNETLPARELVGSDAELLVKEHGLSGVLIQRVTVHLELHLAEETLAGVLGVADEVLGGITDREHVAGGIDVLVGEAGVHTGDGVTGSGDLGGSGLNLVISANEGGEGGNGTSAGLNLGHGDVHNHIGKEITELGNGELGGSAKSGRTGVDAHLVVLVADSSERLEVSIHVQDVRALNVHERGGGVGETLLRAHAHDILDALVEKLGGHDHAIGLAVIGNQLEYGSGRHVFTGFLREGRYILGKGNFIYEKNYYSTLAFSTGSVFALYSRHTTDIQLTYRRYISGHTVGI